MKWVSEGRRKGIGRLCAEVSSYCVSFWLVFTKIRLSADYQNVFIIDLCNKYIFY